MAQLAHALDKNKLQRSSQLMIFWPSDKVELLQHDIQLIDSPGQKKQESINNYFFVVVMATSQGPFYLYKRQIN